MSDWLNFDFLGLNSDTSTRDGRAGYLNPNEYIDFNKSNNTGTPTIGQIGTGSGFNLESLGGIGGLANILASLGNTWNGFQEQQLAKKTLNFEKDAFNRTFANNNKVYNQNMEDILRARSAQTGNNYDNIIAERRL